MISAEELASKIDHTLLRAEATADQIDALCDEALRYGFAGVCVNPVHVRRAAERLASLGGGSSGPARIPAVVAPIGFPLGANLTATKVDEARRAIDDGATEVDMVANLGALVAGDHKGVRADIEAVARVVHGKLHDGNLKVILETGVLTTESIILGCRCCAEAEADFVKTSTGFHPSGGATVDQVRQLYRCASPLGVKASGGIRTAATALEMLEAGATRLGISAGVSIVEELRRQSC